MEEIFFDVEKFNDDLFVLYYYCPVGKAKPVVRMINPTNQQILDLFKLHPISPHMWITNRSSVIALAEHIRRNISSGCADAVKKALAGYVLE